MFERILIPLDGSPLAETILEDVARILHRRDAEVLLLRAVGYPVGRAGDPEALAEAQAYARRMEERLAGQGARARGLVEIGSPAESILAAARREGADMIAMTTHGRSGLARWVFGSVAEKVIRASNVPVLVSRSFKGGRRRSGELAIRSILVPIDESELSLQVIPAAAELAKLFDSRVVIVNILELTPVRVAEDAARRFVGFGLDPEIRILEGDPAHTILDAARETDLIAMCTHGRSGLSRWTLGSVTEKVLRHAEEPVLVVRAK